MEQVGERNVLEHFDELLELAQQSPVEIKKDGVPVAVMMPAEQYHQLKAASDRGREMGEEEKADLEDQHWAQRVEEAKGQEYLSPEESQKFLDDVLEATDEKASE